MKLKMLLKLLRTIVSYVLVGIVLIIVIVPLLLSLLLPEKIRYKNPIYFACVYILFRSVLFFSFLPLRIIGKENMPTSPAIIVANHQSALDIPVIVCALGAHPHVWFVLNYYSNKPILGWFVKRMNFPVDMEDPAMSARSLVHAMRIVKGENIHIIIFPEGGRFNDGSVHQFFDGFTMLAKRLKRPVVPIYMPYNGKIYPPRSFFVQKNTVKVIIGKPFVFEDDDTDESFNKKVRDWFLSVAE